MLQIKSQKTGLLVFISDCESIIQYYWAEVFKNRDGSYWDALFQSCANLIGLTLERIMKAL